MLLIWLQDSGEPWSPESEVQLCYEIKTFLLAGHETSAAMLCWSLFELSQNAEALAAVGAGWVAGCRGCAWVVCPKQHAAAVACWLAFGRRGIGHPF